MPNVPHQQGGCMAPVNHLAQNGVQVLIAGGMGMRPLMGFNQVGIQVLYGNGAQTVGEAVEALLQGKLPQFTTEFTCGGGGGPRKSRTDRQARRNHVSDGDFPGREKLGSNSSAWHGFPKGIGFLDVRTARGPALRKCGDAAEVSFTDHWKRANGDY